jgi:energy-coupling factor transport system permease protein
MSAHYDLYQPGDSWLHRRDPRAKLCLVVCGVAWLLALSNLWLILAALLGIHLLLWSAGIALARLRWIWGLMAPTMIMIVVLWAALSRRWRAPGGLALYPYHRQFPGPGAAVALRVGALGFLIVAWLFTTDQAALVRGLVALGLPYAWGLTLAIALRYLPTMAGTFRSISEAQQARALDLGGRNPIRRARAYLPIVVAMLITALRTAENLARALESRALGAVPRRTYLHTLHYAPADWLFTIAVALGAAVLLWGRLAYGLGADPLRLWGA